MLVADCVPHFRWNLKRNEAVRPETESVRMRRRNCPQDVVAGRIFFFFFLCEGIEWQVADAESKAELMRPGDTFSILELDVL